MSKRATSPGSKKAPPQIAARDFASAAIAESTQRAYKVSLKHFTNAGFKVPATAAEVVVYLTEFAGKLTVGTLKHRLISIHQAHVSTGAVSPVSDRLVKQTLQGIRRTYGSAQRKVRAVVKDDLLEMLVMIERTNRPLQAARNKALLLLGFATACRRSELVALKVEDLQQFDTGMEVLIRRSKTDQEGKGETIFVPFAKGNRCPVIAVQAWLDLAGISKGWLFRQVSRHDRLVGQHPLTPQTVALVVKAAAKSNGGEAAAKLVSGHSLRAGYITTAAEAGHSMYQIKQVSRHRSDAVLAGYIRPVSKRKIPSLL